MLNITFRQLEYFVAVAETGSVSRGADRVLVSQSAMSAALAGIEKSLGLSLLQRHRRGVTLTPGGIELLTRARRIIDQVEDLENIAGEIGAAMRGPLRIGCYSTLAPSLMAKAIDTFVRAHPDVELSFFEGSDVELLTALEGGKCELVITYDYKLDRFTSGQSFTSIGLTSAAPKALVPPGHRLVSAEVRLRELVKEPLILLDLEPSAEYFLELFESRSLTPHIRFKTKSNQLVKKLVSTCLGCALLTQTDAVAPISPQDRAENEPVVRDIADSLKPLPIIALSPAGVRLTRRAEAFLHACRSALLPR